MNEAMNEVVLFLIPFMLALISSLFPSTIINIKNKFPFLFYPILGFAALFSLVLMWVAQLGYGIKYVDFPLPNSIINYSPILLLILYILFFSLSKAIQKQKIGYSVISIAIINSLILGSIVYLFVLIILDKTLLKNLY